MTKLYKVRMTIAYSLAFVSIVLAYVDTYLSISVNLFLTIAYWIAIEFPYREFMGRVKINKYIVLYHLLNQFVFCYWLLIMSFNSGVFNPVVLIGPFLNLFTITLIDLWKKQQQKE